MFERLITLGTFDIPHVGHAAFLQACEAHADEVVIGVNSDAFVQSFKNRTPTYNQTERMDLIRELGYEQVYLNDGPGERFIKNYRADVIAIGTDWLTRNYLAQIGLDEHYIRRAGIAVLFLPYTMGISTTDIRERIERGD